MTDTVFTNSVGETLDRMVGQLQPASVILIADTNTARDVVPRLKTTSTTAAGAPVITVGVGEQNKSLDTLSHIWSELIRTGATRSSLIVNVGGGIVTDIGGMAASTFKRGVRFINIPTTVLAAVDASTGGKTGINFNGLKNEIGLFSPADGVIVSTCFLDTLPRHEILSGYAEMIKHALLDNREHLSRLLTADPGGTDPETFLGMVRDSVAVKERFVAADPLDTGVRHALNLGHTFAHAFEALALERGEELSHGYAVAYGLTAALILSHMRAEFPSDILYNIAGFIKKYYGSPSLQCNDYPQLKAFMSHDKKNHTATDIRFTLLKSVGNPLIGQSVTDEDVTAALDILRDLLQ